MYNFACFVIILLLGLISVDARSIKRSEKSANNLEKVDDTEDPMKVNYDVYPVSQNTSYFSERVSRSSSSCFLFCIWHKDEKFSRCATGQESLHCVGTLKT
jgi:hypothetical protein